MDAELKEKLQRAFDAAGNIARERGLNFDETLQFIADYLINPAT
jgi:hypothetical protein